jgi:hypothetical protein
MRNGLAISALVVVSCVFWLVLLTRAQTAAPTQSGGGESQSVAPVDPEELDQHIDGWGRPVSIEDWHPLNWPTEGLKSAPLRATISRGPGNQLEDGEMASRPGALITIS